MSANEIVLQKLDQGLLTITMNRPDRRNALNPDMTLGLVAAARRAAEVDAVAAEVEALGRRTLRARADVTDRASLELLRDQVLAAFGQVDILVNSAGRTMRVPTIDFAWNVRRC